MARHPADLLVEKLSTVIDFRGTTGEARHGALGNPSFLDIYWR
jgi:hypothetical protein